MSVVSTQSNHDLFSNQMCQKFLFVRAFHPITGDLFQPA